MAQGDSYNMSVPEVIKVQKTIVEGKRREEQCQRSLSVSDKRAPYTITKVLRLNRDACFMCVEDDYHAPYSSVTCGNSCV